MFRLLIDRQSVITVTNQTIESAIMQFKFKSQILPDRWFRILKFFNQARFLQLQSLQGSKTKNLAEATGVRRENHRKFLKDIQVPVTHGVANVHWLAVFYWTGVTTPDWVLSGSEIWMPR